MRKYIQTSTYIEKKQDKELKKLNQELRVPIAELIRQGVAMVLDKYKVKDTKNGDGISEVRTTQGSRVL